ARLQLHKAEQIIESYDLKSLNNDLIIRQAYWHHAFGFPDSAQYFTQGALEKIGPSGNLKSQLDLYTLRGYATKLENDLEAIAYFKQAVSVAKALKDYDALSKLYYEIVAIQTLHRLRDDANQYLDSTITACYEAIANGQEKNYTLSQAFQAKAALYKIKEEIDSAYLFAIKGFAQRELFLEQQQREQIVEIDAQYEDEQRTLLLAQQEQTIRQGRQIRYLLIGVILLTLAMFGVAIYSYLYQRQILTKVKEQAQQLQKVEQAKSRFFTNVSHELRTPLTLIMGPLQNLKDELLTNEKQRKLLELARRNGKQLEQLINEILDLQKLSAGQLQLNQQATDLGTFFQPHLSQFESLASFKAIQYSYEVNVSDGQVSIDQEKCRQMIYNLLSNAFKFTPKGGQIKARVEFKEQDIHIEVSDTGSGIPLADQPYIFDRFFQSGMDQKSASGGTGIGLAICKEYVGLMSGEITVQSQEGKGTTFFLNFPVQEKEVVPIQQSDMLEDLSSNERRGLFAGATSTTAVSPIPGAAAKKRLLLVEDNPELQTYIQLLLEDQYHITRAQNGQEALDLLSRSTDFHLILSDLMMPIMDGFQLLDQLKSQDATRHLPMIMLTARADMASKLTALRIGVDDYLVKPFHEQELRTRIENLIANRANRRPIQPQDTGDVPLPTVLYAAEDQEWLIRFEQFIKDNLSNDLLDVPMIASQFTMSKSSLLRKLKSLTGLSPGQYIHEARLQKARQVLETRSNKTISEVAQKVGYSSVRAFSRNYKKRFGRLPSEV
ncbi:MAG: ATP-binding protein, partial [Bacteroidota bacterium]